MLLQLKYYRKFIAFAILWITYFLCYGLRKPLSIFKYYIESEFYLSQTDLGWTDVSLFLPYCLVQVFGAGFWDGFKPSFVIFANLMVATISMLFLVLSHHYAFFCAAVVLSGAAQAPLWPACIKVLASHVEEKSMGKYVGLLGIAPYAGATVSTALVTYIADRHGWRWSMTPILIICALFSILVLFILRPGSVQPSSRKIASQDMKSLDLLKLPGVSQITVTVFFLKFARYSLFLWLPIYLTQALSFSMIHAGMATSAFQIGAALGGPIVGVWVDKCIDKFKVLSWIMFLSVISAGFLAMVEEYAGFFSVVVSLFVIGFANCGPDSVINGAITLQLVDPAYNSHVTSLVNGLGSLGGLVEGPVTGLTVYLFGWNSVMPMLMLCSLISCIAIRTIKLRSSDINPV